MGKYLFRFGYCTPAQWSANEAHGWDDESSAALFVIADSPATALSWGAEVAEAFVHHLFQAAGWAGRIPGWKEARFAHWLEESPESVFSVDALKQLPVPLAGELPDFEPLSGRIPARRWS